MANASDRPVVVVRDVCKTFYREQISIPVLSGINVEMYAGDYLALMGPSGSGKTTLLNLIAGLDRPTSGSVVVCDQNLGESSEGQLASWRSRHIGFIFQKSNLIPFLSAVENVQIAMQLNGQSTRASYRRAMELLDYLGVADRAANYPSMLSGGQQQRIAVARSLANRPSVILADEPTAALDGQRGRQVMELFAKVAHEQGAGVIVVTHDHRSLDVFDTTYEMEDGMLTQLNTTTKELST